MNPRWVIGLSSGSSADGVDAALLEVEGVGLDLQARLASYGKGIDLVSERYRRPVI